MAHDHGHHHHHSVGENGEPKNIVIAFWLNTGFALLEIAGGLYTNSVAILSDAVHDLGDSLSLGLAYYFHKKSRQEKDERFNYGYRRFSLLGAFINSLILIVSSIFIIRESISRLFTPEQPDAGGMVIFALIGIAVNGFAFLRLKKGGSINEKVVALHFVEDILGWVAVLIASVVMLYVYVPVLDPILSILIAAYILFNVYKNLKTTFRILLQGRPDTVDEATIRKNVLSISGVKDVHDLHFWTMDGQYNVITLHVVVERDQSVTQRESIKDQVKHSLGHLAIQHITVEIESEDAHCKSGVPPSMFLIILILFLVACGDRDAHNTWSVYRGDAANNAYSSLDEINRDNVSNLQVAWIYHTGDAEKGNRSAIQCNPIIVNGVMYVTSPKLKLIALDPASGKEIWKFDPFESANATGVNRGVTYWKNGDDKRVFFSAGSYLYALDADNGQPVSDFGVDGKVDLREGLGRDPAKLSVAATSPGVIYKDLLIQGTALGEGYDAAPGFIRAYDAKSGKIVWTFRSIPQPGEQGYETWPPDAYKEVGGANSWAGMSLDEERGMVYIPTGSPAFDFYGGNRKGMNLYGNCLLALRAGTGELVWYHQLVHHDLWDYDLPAPPNLLTVTHDGKRIDAVAQITKMGMVFVFDRETGEPLFDIEERPVPPSALLGEEVWPTQPFPVKPPPFSRQEFTEADITDISPEANAFVKARLGGAKFGSIYTPPDTKGVVQFPGTRGGGEWGGAAVDPREGIMYVNANEIPFLMSMDLIEVEGQEEFLASAGKRIYTVNACTSCHGSDRSGTNVYPSLLNIVKRKPEREVVDLIRKGKGQMPAFPNIDDHEMDALIAYLFDRNELRNPKVLNVGAGNKKQYRYAHSGWNVLTDQDGYPGVKPPWGTLNAIELNKGEILWKVPLGIYPELVAKGLPPTGTQNLGGPVVTAGGLIFIGATRDRMFRAFDKDTGEILWEYELPAGGNATPSVYEVNGKQYIVIAAGGGGRVGSESSDAYVAFALKP